MASHSSQKAEYVRAWAQMRPLDKVVVDGVFKFDRLKEALDR